jgi:hypothetical protein
MADLLPDPQWVAVKFNPRDRRTYTYENPFEPLKVGDETLIRDPRGNRQTVIVDSIVAKKPPFKCKQIERANDET